MISGKFDPQEFFNKANHVALCVAADEIFGFLKRSVDLPSSWAAMVARKAGGHFVVSSGGEVDGEDAESILFVRTTPIEVAIQEEGLTTKDRFQCRVDGRLRVSVIVDRGELLSFQKAALGSHRVVHVERLTDYLKPAVRSALVAFVADRDASQLLGVGIGDAVATELTEKLQGVCFNAGLVIEAKPELRFDSASYRQVCNTQDEAARRQAEQDAHQALQETIRQSQESHLDELQGLLGRLKNMASISPDVALPELIRSFSENERGQIYEAMFAAEQETRRTQWIVVAMSGELLFFSPSNMEAPARRVPISGEIGPVRSVQAVSCDKNAALFLGSATGVYRLLLGQAEPEVVLAVPDAPSVRGGFNSIAVAGNIVIASHSELGIWAAPLDGSADSRPLFESMTRDAKAVRGVSALEDDVVCSCGANVLAWRAGESGDVPDAVYLGSDATITAVAITPMSILAGTHSGEIFRWARGVTSKPEGLYRGHDRAVESVHVVTSQGVPRMFATDTSLAVRARVLGDSFECQYDAGGQTLRRVEVASDLVVATNDLRDRLFVWSPAKPGKPQSSISIGALTGRSIQDVCLV